MRDIYRRLAEAMMMSGGGAGVIDPSRFESLGVPVPGLKGRGEVTQDITGGFFRREDIANAKDMRNVAKKEWWDTYGPESIYGAARGELAEFLRKRHGPIPSLHKYERDFHRSSFQPMAEQELSTVVKDIFFGRPWVKSQSNIHPSTVSPADAIRQFPWADYFHTTPTPVEAAALVRRYAQRNPQQFERWFKPEYHRQILDYLDSVLGPIGGRSEPTGPSISPVIKKFLDAGLPVPESVHRMYGGSP